MSWHQGGSAGCRRECFNQERDWVMGLQVGSLLDALAEGDSTAGMDNLSWAENIKSSHKFLIRNTMDLLDDKITDYAMLLINSNLLRLPFEKCYFEFQNYSIKSNVIAVAAAAVAGTSPDGVECTVTRAFARLRNSDYAWDYYAHCAGWKHVTLDGEISPLINMPDIFGASGILGSDEFKADEGVAGATLVLVAAAIAFMDLKEVKQTEKSVSGRVNLHRLRSGKAPLFSHTEVFINRSARGSASAHHETLLSRRAHWRRGHLRHLPDKIVPIRPALIRGEGFLSKDYII